MIFASGEANKGRENNFVTAQSRWFARGIKLKHTLSYNHAMLFKGNGARRLAIDLRPLLALLLLLHYWVNQLQQAASCRLRKAWHGCKEGRTQDSSYLLADCWVHALCSSVVEDEGKLPELMMTSEHVGGSTGVENMSGGKGLCEAFLKMLLFFFHIYIHIYIDIYNLMFIIKKESSKEVPTFNLRCL